MEQGARMLLDILKKGTEKTKVEHFKAYDEKNWEDILNVAAQQKVLPLLYCTLKKFKADTNVPGNNRDKLYSIYFQSAARNMRFYQQLLKIISILNNADVPVILLKGAHLAEKVYGNIALRPMIDIDLLVKKNNLEIVHNLMIENGFKSSKTDPGSYQRSLPSYRKNNFPPIEMHYQISGLPFSKLINITELWDRSRIENFQSFDVLTLSPEDLILHICMHTSFQHGFENGLISLFDIAYTIEHYDKEIDYKELLIRAKQWELDRCLFLMLALTERMIGFSIPEQIQREMDLEQKDMKAIAVAEELIFDKGISFVGVSSVSPFIARLFAPIEWRLKIKYLKQRSFPPKEDMFITNQGTGYKWHLMLFWHYLVRLKTLLVRHGNAVWSGLLKKPETVELIESQNKRNELRDWLLERDKSVCN